MKRYALALDLVNDPELMAEYEAYHQAVWPEIRASIKDAGIEDMAIYRFGNRLFMTMDVNDAFSFEKKNEIFSFRDDESVRRFVFLSGFVTFSRHTVS